MEVNLKALRETALDVQARIKGGEVRMLVVSPEAMLSVLDYIEELEAELREKT